MLTITLTVDPQTGQLSLSGPLENKGLMLTVLADAMKAVLAHKPQPRLALPPGVRLPADLRNGG